MVASGKRLIGQTALKGLNLRGMRFTPQALFELHGSRPWNPLIASVFYRRGIIETWGQGTLRMAAWSAEAGLPKPEILEVPGAVVVRFRAKASGKAETTGKRWGNAGEDAGRCAAPASRAA